MGPYISIWFNTRRTIKEILNTEIPFDNRIPILLTCIASIIPQLNNTENSIIYKIVDSLLVFGAIWVFLFYLYPYALYRIGRTSEGQEDFKTLRTIVSLSTIPTIIELLFVIIAIFTGNSLDFENHHPLLSGIIALFSFNILVIGTSMVQRFPLNQSMIYAGLPVFFIIVIYMIFSY